MKALLVAAGMLPTYDLLAVRAHAAEVLIAIDGGLAAFDGCGIVPDLMIGDFDSVDPALLARYQSQGVAIQKAPAEKDETDGMLALDAAIGMGATDIILLGATGGRIDHLLSNLMLLKRASARGVALVIEDEIQEITLHHGSFQISGEIGQTVSILPMDEQACVSAAGGLYYPLDHLVLKNDQPRGVSNLLTAAKASIESDGEILIIKNKIDV